MSDADDKIVMSMLRELKRTELTGDLLRDLARVEAIGKRMTVYRVAGFERDPPTVIVHDGARPTMHAIRVALFGPRSCN